MPIILPDTSGLATGITTAGSALAQAMAQSQMQKQESAMRQAEKNEQLERYGMLANTLDVVDLGTPQGQQALLRQGLNTGTLDEALNMIKVHQTTQTNRPLTVQETEGMSRILGSLGIPDQEAADISELYAQSNVGGRTEIIKMAVDRLQRTPRLSVRSEEPMDPDADVEPAIEGYDFPTIDIAPGLTPKERVQREKEVFNANAKDFNEITQKAKSLKDESYRLDLLERFNDSKKLPEGLGRLNINWTTGDIRVPALANAETQAFVKGINDFTTKAKETYGARVTNFELGAFMRRLPTLANSEEGRRLILEQMQALNDIEQLYHDSLREVYDHYGLRGVDRQQAERIAEDIRKPQEDELRQKYLESTSAQVVFEAKQEAPEGLVPVQSPDGQIGYLPIDKLDTAAAKGYKIL